MEFQLHCAKLLDYTTKLETQYTYCGYGKYCFCSCVLFRVMVIIIMAQTAAGSMYCSMHVQMQVKSIVLYLVTNAFCVYFTPEQHYR